jgi:hypothetical protein
VECVGGPLRSRHGARTIGIAAPEVVTAAIRPVSNLNLAKGAVVFLASENETALARVNSVWVARISVE